MNKTESKLHIRPRFQLEVPLDPAIIKDQIKLALDSNESTCKGNIVDNHVILRIPVSQQHYWSPQLTLTVDTLDGGSQIRGLYGPKPGVWTMFVFFYSAIGFLTLMGLIFGLSQMMLNMDAYGLWSFPVGSFLLFGLFIISKIGQGLGHDQMHQLKDFLDNTLKTNHDNLDL